MAIFFLLNSLLFLCVVCCPSYKTHKIMLLSHSHLCFSRGLCTQRIHVAHLLAFVAIFVVANAWYAVLYGLWWVHVTVHVTPRLHYSVWHAPTTCHNTLHAISYLVCIALIILKFSLTLKGITRHTCPLIGLASHTLRKFFWLPYNWYIQGKFKGTSDNLC